MIYRGGVTVSPLAAKDRPGAADSADLGFVDMRGGSRVRAGTFSYDGRDLDTGWHSHDLHQIEYAFEGFAEVETEGAHYLLPPQQAIWIPAGLPHRTTLRRVRSVAVFFDPALVDGAADRACVLAATPVIREMIVYAARWPIDRAVSDAVADAFFDALAQLAVEWLAHEAPLCLPTTDDPVVREVMAYTGAHLADVTLAGVCAAVGVSERSLRRKFGAVAGITWREYVLQSRLLRAIGRLTEPGTTVLSVATEVGFDSVSAFTRAFRGLTGETPSAYRRRVQAGVGNRTPGSRRSAATAAAQTPTKSPATTSTASSTDL
jgi:AraC-like DNA-binding protein